jgi:hypothetical protein
MGLLMKCRNGFVSNSSSASFIVTVKAPKKDICGSLFNDLGWNYFSPPIFIRDTAKKIEGYKKSLVEQKKEIIELKKIPLEERKKSHNGQDPLYWKNHTYEMYKRFVKEDQAKIKSIKKYPDPIWKAPLSVKIKLIEEICGYNHLNLVNKKDSWRFRGWTSMFNSYADIPELLKEIVLLSVFRGFDVITDVVNDG